MSTVRTSRRGSGRRRALLGLLIALASVTMTLAAELPEAAAHSDLTASAPSAGSRGDAPDTVRLTFSDTVEPTFASVALTVDDAPPVTLPTRVDGSDVIATPPAANATADAPQVWKVAYRVVSRDGHPITGTISFTVTLPPGTAPSGTASRPATPDRTPSPAAPVTSSAPASPAPTSPSPASTLPAGSPSEGDSHPSPGWPFIVFIAVLVLVGPVLAGLVQLLPARPEVVDQPAADGPAQDDGGSGQPPLSAEGGSETDRATAADLPATGEPVPTAGTATAGRVTTGGAEATTDASKADGDPSPKP